MLSVITSGNGRRSLLPLPSGFYQHVPCTAEKKLWRCVENCERDDIDMPRANTRDLRGFAEWVYAPNLIKFCSIALSDTQRSFGQSSGCQFPEVLSEVEGNIAGYVITARVDFSFKKGMSRPSTCTGREVSVGSLSNSL
jgi:hypothetical protein